MAVHDKNRSARLIAANLLAQRRKGAKENAKRIPNLLCGILCAFAPLRENLFIRPQNASSILDKNRSARLIAANLLAQRRKGAKENAKRTQNLLCGILCAFAPLRENLFIKTSERQFHARQKQERQVDCGKPSRAKAQRRKGERKENPESSAAFFAPLRLCVKISS